MKSTQLQHKDLSAWWGLQCELHNLRPYGMRLLIKFCTDVHMQLKFV